MSGPLRRSRICADPTFQTPEDRHQMYAFRRSPREHELLILCLQQPKTFSVGRSSPKQTRWILLSPCSALRLHQRPPPVRRQTFDMEARLPIPVLIKKRGCLDRFKDPEQFTGPIFLTMMSLFWAILRPRRHAPRTRRVNESQRTHRGARCKKTPPTPGCPRSF